jgi:hypothetical protein
VVWFDALQYIGFIAMQCGVYLHGVTSLKSLRLHTYVVYGTRPLKR